MRWLLVAALAIVTGCIDPPERMELGEACKGSWHCKSQACLEGVCVDAEALAAARQKQSAERSLEAATVPKSETLPEGLFTRIRTSQSKGWAVAACAANEWLTGGSCSPTQRGEQRRWSTAEPGPDGTARGGRWTCKVSYADSPLTATAICATVRESTAEIGSDAGPER